MPQPKPHFEVLANAIRELRGLLSEAVNANNYNTIAEIAGLLAGLDELQPMPASAALAKQTTKGTSTFPSQGLQEQPKSRFPRFEREGNRLIKIGWSKKDRRSYEHKAPFESVILVAETAARVLKPGKAFALDRLGTVAGPKGTPIPSYQVYITLRWMRELGIVTKQGKSEYMLARTVSSEELARTFQTMPERAASGASA